jgi:hypothetical protein
MKIERQHTRDQRENRFEREEKLAQAMETLPGKTLRDRDAPRKKSFRSNRDGLGIEVAMVSKVPLAAHAAKPPGRTVGFRLNAPEAAAVHLAGTFNGWDPGASSLSRGADGAWHLELPLEPGAYEYRFVVDGLWREDPSASESVENPFGSRNSLLHVT